MENCNLELSVRELVLCRIIPIVALAGISLTIAYFSTKPDVICAGGNKDYVNKVNQIAGAYKQFLHQLPSGTKLHDSLDRTISFEVQHKGKTRTCYVTLSSSIEKARSLAVKGGSQ